MGNGNMTNGYVVNGDMANGNMFSGNMINENHSFMHPPLQDPTHQIRLVNLDYSTKDLPTCSIQVENLDLNPHFHALSYTWGPAKRHETVSVDDHPLRISDNLASFLRHYSASSMLCSVTGRHALHCPLWIDQLAIDQADADERSEQVALMHRIFGGAAQTVVWLGPEADESATVFSWFTHFRMRLLAKDRKRLLHVDGQFGILERAMDALGLEEAELVTGLKKLFERPYWSRLWVLQEIICSRGIVLLCGSRFLSSYKLDACYPMVRRLLQKGDVEKNDEKAVAASSSSSDRIFDALCHSAGAGASYDLRQALDFCSLECHDIRDKVFALNGILNDEWKIRVDYSLAPWEVIIAVAETLVHDRSVSSPVDGETRSFMELLQRDRAGDVCKLVEWMGQGHLLKDQDFLRRLDEATGYLDLYLSGDIVAIADESKGASKG